MTFYSPLHESKQLNDGVDMSYARRYYFTRRLPLKFP
jgi:hypothetical protein